MTFLKQLTWVQLAWLFIVPLTAFAISWSNERGSAPPAFRRAIEEIGGIRVTEVCRSMNARYGARNSVHKRCQAMDISKNTPRNKVEALRRYGLCPQWHPKGYYGATGDHWHVVMCSNPGSRGEARRDQRPRAQELRREGRSRGRNSGRRSSYSPSSNDGGWSDRAFGNR